MPVMERIQAEVDGHPIVLFMKGTPQFPMCGFSSRAVQALRDAGAAQIRKRSGIKMPQMVTALRRPMALTPAKFTSVESQSSAIVKHCTTPKSA